MRRWLFWVLPVVAAGILTFFSPALRQSVVPVPAQTQTQGSAPETGQVLSQGGSLEGVYQNAVDAAVRINVGNSGIGSGFFISQDGLVLTAAHVALGEPGTPLSVVVSARQQLPAKLVGYDEFRDLAVLKVEGSNFPYLKLSSSTLKVGDAVVAIGNSRGNFDGGRAGRVTGLDTSLDPTFPSGLVSSTMPLAPGDSGGPVLNAKGEVVGVSTAISRINGRFSSYFVPVTAGSPIVGQLQAGLKRGVPVLGVSVADASQYLDLQGALVTEVMPGLGAQKAGLRPAEIRQYRDDTGQVRSSISSADVIVGVDGRRVTSPSELVAYLRGKAAGDTVRLKVQRGGQTVDIAVTLSNKPVA